MCYNGEIFLQWAGETLEQIVQRSRECFATANVQGQVGLGFEQSDVVKVVPFYCKGGWN